MPNIIPVSSASPATPPTTPPSPATPGGELGKNQFLQLLVAQMRYQDPMSPMDSHQLAADLAQFSGLEQLVNINDKLDTQSAEYASMVSSMNNSVALGAIGHSVVAPGDQITLAPDKNGVMTGNAYADIAIEGNGTLEILDSNGKVIGTESLGYLKVGDMQKLDVTSAAANLPAGTYTFRVTVTDAQGAPQQQTTYMAALIDGISYSSSGAVLTSGSLNIPIGSVRRIAG